MYDEILFPTDGSDGAEAALDHVIQLAEVHDAAIHLLFVVDTTYLGSDAGEATALESLQTAGEQALEDASERARARGLEVTREIRRGDPYGAILDYCEDTDVDLVVMGTHGRSGLERFLLGSVTEKVVRAAEVPVLTVRAEDDDEQ